MTQHINEQQDVLQKAQELRDNMLAITQPSAIFGEPVQMGEQTILTASEVGAAMGVGKVIAATGGGGTSLSPKAKIQLRQVSKLHTDNCSDLERRRIHARLM